MFDPDQLVEALLGGEVANGPLETCKKCGEKTRERHMYLCRGCFDEMGLKGDFDPKWSPSN